ncbi:AfsR/SARP family transcriptional regulator [Kutzneria chonburiensis]|uniref:BTAD domain-containing putative transcriptional regulator n=1 Tax=Kutzneria chonburiensis TaxID=1483604 RepID=A0ABV6MMR6_9PSEU|nr:BTAD domain-containing putative transcriptional regulator [Kutzneria chonburiensis]
MSDTPLYFRLLGPLHVLVGDEPIMLTSSRERKLLALLLFSRGQVVPVERIIEALWDDEPPATAKGQIQTCVFTLRQQFRERGSGELLRTQAAGYAIEVPGECFDVAEFERLLGEAATNSADGRPEQAIEHYRAALGLWRGPTAATVDGRLLQAIAGRLNEDRIRAQEECIDLELSLGRHSRLVGELSELVEYHPLREHLRAQHMLALYRSARQAEALESFHEVRRILQDDLGIQPGDELTALHQAILAQDPALDTPREPRGSTRQTAAPRQLPAAISDFTGRQDLLEELTTLLTVPPADDAGRPLPIACLTGGGGVGKTVLAVQAAHAVRHAYPDGQLFVQSQGPDGRPADPMDLLARLISSLGGPAKSLPENLTDRTAVYRSWLSDRRMIIVLDDLAGVRHATALLPGTPACAVIITSRRPLTSLPGARHIKVGSLDEDACVDLLTKVVGADRVAAEPDAVRDLVRLCAHLPLAVRIAAAKLATRPYWMIGQLVHRMRDEMRRLDELAIDGLGIRATLTESFTGLGACAQQLLVRLSLLGTADFGCWVSAPLLDVDFDEASDALDELVGASLVEVRVDDTGPPRFRLHDLVRIYAQERLASTEGTLGRTSTLRRLLSCWLSLTVEAHRRACGADYGVHGTTESWDLPEYARDLMLGQPMDWLRQERAGLLRAVGLAARIGLDELCWDLAVTLVPLFEADYLVEDWRKTHRTALLATRQAGNARGEAAVLCSLGNLALVERHQDAPQHFEPARDAFAALGDTHGHALALSGLAFCDLVEGRYEQSLRRFDEALAGFRAVGAEIGAIDALCNMAQIKMDWEDYAHAGRLLDDALSRCGQLRSTRIYAQLQYRVADLRLRTGDLAGAEQTLGAVLDVVMDTGDLLGQASTLAGLGAVKVRQGRYGSAEQDLATSLAISRRMESNPIRGRALLALAELSVAQCDWNRANALVSEGLVVFSETGSAGVTRARFLAVKARIDDQFGNPMTAAAARREALQLVGDADTALSRALAEAIEAR